jgi:cytochrome c-type biogenesis protein CcmF
MVQERRGMLRVWNVSLVILTFFLTIFGTFMTRSGVVQSVHAFGEDPELARLFTIFMVTTIVVAFGFVIYRLPLLRARNELDSWISREAAFLFNNWILLFSAFFVLFATMFPTLSEAVTGNRITVGPPFFNRWMIPIGLVLLLLTGVGPLLAWKKSTLVNLRDQFLIPVSCGLITGVAVVALGVRVWSSGICFTLSGFVLGTLSQELWRGARVRQQATGTDVFTAMVGLVGRNKRRYGGYIIHVAIVLMFLGFAGEGFKASTIVLLTPGQEVTVRDYTVRLDSVRVTEDSLKQAQTAYMTVLRNGTEFTKMYPARWTFWKTQDQPTTEVAIRRGFAEDLYITVPQFDVANQAAHTEVVVTPLVNWVWLGFGVLALGTLLALMPESAFSFATAKVPAHAATASMLLLVFALGSGPAHAQHDETASSRESLKLQSEEQRAITRKMACWCADLGSGGCPRRPVGECECGHCAMVRAEVLKLMQAGFSEQQIFDHFAQQQGGWHILREPPDTGFNRLAWFAPYALAAAGLAALILTTRRWSRASTMATAGDAPIDPTLNARLDDELRDLD